MKVAFNGIVKTYKIPVVKPSTEITNEKIAGTKFSYETYDCSCFKPLTNDLKTRRKELKEIDKLTKENGIFSLDKAADLLKNKIDAQLMLYSVNDIKNIISTVQKNNPETTREEILNVLMKLSSFSNYDSFDIISDFCKDNDVVEIYKTNELSLNSIMSYFSNSSKGFLKLQLRQNKDNINKVIFIDREIIKDLKKQKEEDSNYFSDLKANINNGTTKLVVLDGFEAKTKDGLKSFNFAGQWGDLAEVTNSVVKSQKEGKNPFVDDIVKDLNDIFGKNVKINIINNDIKNPDEKQIAERFNPKTISKEEIKKSLLGISKYSWEVLANQYGALKNEDKNSFLNTAQGALTKAFYPVMEVYSPRRQAFEISTLHKKIENILVKKGKTFDDVIFVVPNKKKSFGLISYQYSKVNNTDNPFIYPNFQNVNIDRNLTRGKIFLFLDDYSGSGQSFVNKDLPYQRFKRMNPANSIIFASIAATDFAQFKIDKEITEMRNSLRNNYEDYFVSAHHVKDIMSYIKLFTNMENIAVMYAKKCGYNAGKDIILFPHVIPDNCMDIAGFFLKSLLKSDNANKADMDFQKECRINTLSEMSL